MTREVYLTVDVKFERDAAESKAWDALTRYKFWMFGYHASQWVLLNRVAQERHPNPFSDLVRCARAHQAAASVGDLAELEEPPPAEAYGGRNPPQPD